MVQKNDAKVVHESDNLLVLKANRALNESEFTLLSNLVKKEEEKSGVKIVLVPFSTDVVDIPSLQTGGELPGQGDDEPKAKAEAEQKAKEEDEQKAKEEADAKAKAEQKEDTKKDK